MPYKDPEVRRVKARLYTAAHRAKNKLLLAAVSAPPRFCKLCSVDISGKRKDAKFCSREHKRVFSDKQRNFAKEYAANREARQAKALRLYYADVECSRQKQRARQKANLPIFAANQAKRRSAKMQRTPAWLSSDDLWLIQQAYKTAEERTALFGFRWHVDHVVPLQGKRVSGLHVPHNLQVIPARDNIAKNNSFEVK